MAQEEGEEADNAAAGDEFDPGAEKSVLQLIISSPQLNLCPACLAACRPACTAPPLPLAVCATPPSP